MKTNTIVKVLVDIGMTIILMLLMAYELVGRQAHEWLGMRFRSGVSEEDVTNWVKGLEF